ncbi:biotin/lipoyl-binding protein [Oscillospiraceae bacterium MB08-C2-2]|nr:biotin/lipoyl-binding protein [Oscillospiraceae bacterium MB08-C2-2]
MNMVTKAWNYQPAAEIRQSIKTRAISAIVWLLALMVCFTLISRATASMTVPIVDTEKPSPATISHTVIVDGVVETVGDSGVIAAGGALVREVSVKEGDTVAAGDLLFTYDSKDFNRQIAQYQTDLGKVGANLKAFDQQNTLDQENRERARERAQEDLNAIETYGDLDVQIAEEQVRAAGERVRAARDALNKYDGIRRSDYDEGEYTKKNTTGFVPNIGRRRLPMMRQCWLKKR